MAFTVKDRYVFSGLSFECFQRTAPPPTLNVHEVGVQTDEPTLPQFAHPSDEPALPHVAPMATDTDRLFAAERKREHDAELSRQQFRSQKLVEVLQIAIERREYLLSLQAFRSPRDAASSADAVERVTVSGSGISDDVAPLTARGHLRGAAHLPPPPPAGRAGSIFGEAASDYSYSAHEEYYSEYSYAADAAPADATPADATPADADYYEIEYDYSEYSAEGDDGATANMTELLLVDEYAAPAPEPSLSRVPVSGTLAGLHVNE